MTLLDTYLGEAIYLGASTLASLASVVLMLACLR